MHGQVFFLLICTLIVILFDTSHRFILVEDHCHNCGGLNNNDLRNCRKNFVVDPKYAHELDIETMYFIGCYSQN